MSQMTNFMICWTSDWHLRPSWNLQASVLIWVKSITLTTLICKCLHHRKLSIPILSRVMQSNAFLIAIHFNVHNLKLFMDSASHRQPRQSIFIWAGSLIETHPGEGICPPSSFHILTSNASFVSDVKKRKGKRKKCKLAHLASSPKDLWAGEKIRQYPPGGVRKKKSNPQRNRMLIYTSQMESVFCKVLCFACLEPIILKATLPPSPLRSIRSGVQLQCCEIEGLNEAMAESRPKKQPLGRLCIWYSLSSLPWVFSSIFFSPFQQFQKHLCSLCPRAAGLNEFAWLNLLFV